jgi:hypothetical protein
MKNWKTAAGLGVALLALGGLATWDEWKTKKEEKDKESTNLLTTIKPDQVKSFTFHSTGDADTDADKKPKAPDPTKIVDVAATKIDGKWQLTSPVKEAADQQTIQDLLKNITDYKYESEVASGADQWEMFGLKQPRRKIDLQLENGSITSIMVGINAPVGFAAYSATSQSDKVYTGSQHIATSMSKSLFDFRDKKLIGVSSSEIESLSMTVDKNPPLTLSKKDGKWTITSPENTEADTVQVNNLLDDLTGVKATEFIGKPSKEIADAFATKKVHAKLEFATAAGTKATLFLATPKEGLYASLDPATKIVKIGDEYKSKLIKSVNDLRNKKIFSFQSSEVDKVNIDSKVYKRVKDDWYAADDAAKFKEDGTFPGKETERPAAKGNVRGFLVDLEYAKAEELLPPETLKKLSPPPKNRIVLEFSAQSKKPPLTVDVWQVNENPEQVYIVAGNTRVAKAKKSILASMTEASVLPAAEEKMPSAPTTTN